MKYKILIFLILIFAIGTHVPYKFNKQKAVEYATQHAAPRSRCMCAWYVMRSLQKGGCPLGIYPAYAYRDILPKMGYQQIDPKNVEIGDICVMSQNSGSRFGHIAIYNGKQWVSDYRQSNLYPNRAYREESTCCYYRIDDGWHTANIWVSPVKLIGYLKVFFTNIKRIKFL